MGTDIEHINGTEGIQRKIQHCCDQTAAEIQAHAELSAFFSMVSAVIQSADAAKGNQQDMPCIGVDRQREISVVHATGVKEGEDTS